MKFLVNLLLMPVLLNAFAVNKSINDKKEKELEKQITEKVASNTSLGTDKITVDLSSDPYEGDFFLATFHYNGTVPLADYWIEDDNLITDYNASHLFYDHYIDIEVYCLEEKGNFTLNLMDGNDDVFNLTVYTHLTDYGIFASVGSQAVCDNMVLEYEYNCGLITEQDLIDYANTPADTFPLLPRPWLRPIFDDLIPQNPAPSGRTIIKGAVEWEDSHSNMHPANGLKVELWQTSISRTNPINSVAATYVDEDGNYSFNLQSSTLTGMGTFIRVYAETSRTDVAPFYIGLGTYSKDYNISFTTGNINTKNITINKTDDFVKPVEIANCIHYGEEYIRLVDGRTPPVTHVKWPDGNSCCAGNSHIMLGSEYYQIWDVILHEYGHIIQDFLGINPGVSKTHTFTHDYSNRYGKNTAMKLAFQEATASVLGLAIQSTYMHDLTNKDHVADSYYDDLTWFGNNATDPTYHDPQWDFENTHSTFVGLGEANEIATGNVLYDLWDIDTHESHDKVYLGNGGFWDLLKNSKAKTLSALFKYIYDNNIVERNNLAYLVDYYGLSARDIDQAFNTSNLPVICWTDSGNVANYCAGPSGSACIGDEYNLIFYNASGSYLFEVNGIRSNAYYLTYSQWQTILNQPGTYYQIQIGAKSTLGGFTTGPYYGKKKIMTKSLSGYVTFDISSLGGATSYGNSSNGGANFSSSNLVTNVNWSNVSITTNSSDVEFFSLNAGMSSSHISTLAFNTSKTFNSVSMDVVFATNRSSHYSTFLIYKWDGTNYVQVEDVDCMLIPMDKNNTYRTFTFSMNGNVKGFKIWFEGFGYTTLCIKNVTFDTRIV